MPTDGWPNGHVVSGTSEPPCPWVAPEYAAAMRAEFTIEPFVDGNPGPHVAAAIAAATAAGAEVSVGPFGTELAGDDAVVLQAVDALARAAVDAGATRVTVQLNV